MDTNTTIGTPVYGTQKERKDFSNFNWKVTEDAPNEYRILPPFGSLAKEGQWFKYEAIHWGVKTSDGRFKVYRCVQRKNFKTKMIEVQCPMCKKIAEVQASRDARKATLEKEKKSKDEIATLLKPLNDWLQINNLQKGYFVNALRPDGKIGRLFLKIKAKQALDARIQELVNKKGIRPIDVDQGVWFRFTRNGTGQATAYGAELVYDERTIDGETVQVLKKAPLSEEVLKRMATEAFDLGGFYKDLTVSEIEMLVSAGGDVTIADTIFGTPTVTQAVPEIAPPEDDEPAPVEAKAEVKTAPAMVVEGDVDPEEAALLAQMMALKAKKAAKAAPVAATTGSDDDFMAAFKAGKL